MHSKRLRSLSALFALALALAAAGQSYGAGQPPKPAESGKSSNAGRAKPKPAKGACAGRQVFAPWQDTNKYILMTGGAFERGIAALPHKGGVRAVAGNETFFANAKTDRYSLSLPTGSSVTLHAKCVRMLYPIIRFFVTNTGDPSAVLRVTVSYRDKRGVKRTVRLGDVKGTAEWQPTAMLAFLDPKAALATQSNGNIWLTIAPVGAGGVWRIDDVFIDPYKLT